MFKSNLLRLLCGLFLLCYFSCLVLQEVNGGECCANVCNNESDPTCKETNPNSQVKLATNDTNTTSCLSATVIRSMEYLANVEKETSILESKISSLQVLVNEAEKLYNITY